MWSTGIRSPLAHRRLGPLTTRIAHLAIRMWREPLGLLAQLAQDLIALLGRPLRPVSHRRHSAYLGRSLLPLCRRQRFRLRFRDLLRARLLMRGPRIAVVARPEEQDDPTVRTFRSRPPLGGHVSTHTRVSTHSQDVSTQTCEHTGGLNRRAASRKRRPRAECPRRRGSRPFRSRPSWVCPSCSWWGGGGQAAQPCSWFICRIPSPVVAACHTRARAFHYPWLCMRGGGS